MKLILKYLSKLFFWIGLCLIFGTFASVFTLGWDKSPELIQKFGEFLRIVSSVPILGNFVWVFWGVPLLPALLFAGLAYRYQSKTAIEEQKVYRIKVYDHFHYMDEDESYVHGEYDTFEEAVEVSKRIVDRYLESKFDQSPSAKELFDDYMSFGEDPSIEGENWSASEYAQTKAEELFNERDTETNSLVMKAQDIWSHQVFIQYGQLLPQSEILEDEECFYYCQTDRNQLIAAWHKYEQVWKIDINRNQLEDLPFSTPHRFEEAVFGNDKQKNSVERKQFLVEFLLYGIAQGDIKTVSKSLEDGSKVEFSLDYKTWNEMVIGNQVGVEGACRHLTENEDDEQILHMALLCEGWNVTLEVVFGEYEDYEQLEFGIKEFDGYYNRIV